METYYDPADLGLFSGDGIGEGSPELWNLYMAYYGKVFDEGALTAREKALIALAVAAAVQCPYCIDSYTNSCLSKGVTEEQMTEAFHVANAIRGGAALVHGVQMKKLVDKLEM
ncbi:MAG: arsenosugar biosynthesis-associated peroxidase-like protein [Eggerthellaceae bacterium]|nr:arsenosugar biosynthesis-associated peroxidase-like protein [Eggerthellaceae bacterium]